MSRRRAKKSRSAASSFPGADAALVALLLAVVAMLVVPLTPWLIDLMVGLNLCLATVVFCLAMLAPRPIELTAFPTVLLVATLYRLALNVASTRLILTEADAGRIIGAFGTVLVGGDILIGAVIFGILAMVLFLVITKGAERVAEVAARFTLDALPGMQLAIDADLRAGAVSPREVGRRREALERRSHYFGALDGAMKFVRGDAVASMVIILVNVLGGLAVGIIRHGMSAAEALRVYGRLTVGDGLVNLIPALLLSTAAGMLVTRVGQGDAEARLGRQLGEQVGRQPRALLAAALPTLALALVPGLPVWPFVLLGGALLVAGLICLRSERLRGAARDRESGRFERRGGDRPLGLDETQEVLDRLATSRPVLVRETVPGRVSLAGLADLLHALELEGIGAEHLAETLEAVAREPAGLEPDELLQRVRQRLAPLITSRLAGGKRELDVAVLEDELESVLESGLTPTASGKRLALPAELGAEAVAAIAAGLEPLPRPLLLVKPALRLPLARLLRAASKEAVVLAHGEIEDRVPVRVAGSIGI
ncbi:MAG: flagellar biosynthesis protein FlhA [Polyangia bacterium]